MERQIVSSARRVARRGADPLRSCNGRAGSVMNRCAGSPTRLAFLLLDQWWSTLAFVGGVAHSTLPLHAARPGPGAAPMRAEIASRIILFCGFDFCFFEMENYHGFSSIFSPPSVFLFRVVWVLRELYPFLGLFFMTDFFRKRSALPAGHVGGV